MSAANELSSRQIPPSEINDFDDLDRYLDFISLVESIDPEMQIQRLKAFILVARYPELNTQELATKAGMPGSSMSRNLSSLGEWNPLAKKDGYGLIYGRNLRDDRRNKIHMLTQKGREFAVSFLTILDQHAEKRSLKYKNTI
jgi:DNA-binding MarR family transcriptional regulator